MLELAAQLPSTPALSRTQPSEDAYDNHGPERVEDASVAARRHYRSPSHSDVEYDEDGAYRSVARPMDVAAAGGTGGAKVGKGAKIDKESRKGKSRLRAARIITAQEDQARIQQTLLHGTREEQTTLFRYREIDRGASRVELIEIVREVAPDRSPDSIQSRHLPPGQGPYRPRVPGQPHPGRSGRTPPGQGRYADKSKSAVKKATRGPAKKTMTHRSTGWTKIENAMKADRDTSPFYGEWRKVEKKGRSGSYLPPSQMSPGLAATVAGLRSRYTVGRRPLCTPGTSAGSRSTRKRSTRRPASDRPAWARPRSASTIRPSPGTPWSRTPTGSASTGRTTPANSTCATRGPDG